MTALTPKEKELWEELSEISNSIAASIARANVIAKELRAGPAKFYVDGIRGMQKSLNTEIDAATRDERWRYSPRKVEEK